MIPGTPAQGGTCPPPRLVVVRPADRVTDQDRNDHEPTRHATEEDSECFTT